MALHQEANLQPRDSSPVMAKSVVLSGDWKIQVTVAPPEVKDKAY